MTTELSFDENGYLIPCEEIETNMETLKKYFVDAFPNSQTRKLIFANYEKFITDFQYEIFPHFEQWIGGSFVTLKENPNDIDVTTFVDYKVVDLRGDKIEKFWSYSMENKRIDSYIVREYQERDIKYQTFLKAKRNRKLLYASTRNNKLPKGFLKLTFKK